MLYGEGLQEQRTSTTWREKTCDPLWRRVYRKREPVPVDVLIQMQIEVIGHIRKDLVERDDLSQYERSFLEGMLDKSYEELEELMNPDDEDAKMKKKKKEEDYERDIVSHSPMMAEMDKRCRLLKRKADEGDEEAAKELAKKGSTCF